MFFLNGKAQYNTGWCISVGQSVILYTKSLGVQLPVRAQA